MSAVILKEDSDGERHQICCQSQQNTCFAAALFMIKCILEQRSAEGGEEEILALVGRLGSTLAEGISYPALVRLMKRFVAKVTVEESQPGRQLFLKSGWITPVSPALVAVEWSFGGFHIIVSPRFLKNGSKIVYLDTLGGYLNERVNNGAYVDAVGDSATVRAVIYTC